MPTFVTLLRGVNVGKAKRVSMSELRTLFSGLGYTKISTLLNSGNAVFHASKGTPAKHAADIAAAISHHLKIEVPVIVKSAKELAIIISANPINADEAEHSRLLVVFVQDTKELFRLAAIESLLAPGEQFAVGKNAAYLLCPAGILASRAWEALLGKVGRSATTRNWATVLRLNALASVRDA